MRTEIRIAAVALVLAFAGSSPARADQAGSSFNGRTPPAALLQLAGAQGLPDRTNAPRWSALQADDPGAQSTTLIQPAALPAEGEPIRLGAAPSTGASGLMAMMPRLGDFDLTFYSNVPASGLDGMVNADVVISLTRHF